MDIIAFNEAATANERIEKIIANPDSVAGLISVPNLVPTGETITIPAGRTVVHPNLQVDGTLVVDGTLFVPSGGTYTADTVSVDTVNVANNLVFASGAKIQGDFSNATIASRTAFQTSVVDSPTRLLVLPNGIAQTSQIALVTNSDPTNASYATLGISPSALALASSISGSGTYLPMTFYTGGAERLRIDTLGNVLVTGSGGLGYGTGSGGTVTQLTSKSTAVTLNKPCGQITMHNASLAAGSQVTFNMFNSLVTSKDNCTVGINGGASNGGFYRVRSACQDGFSQIYVENITGSSLSEALVIQFNIVKGATA